MLVVTLLWSTAGIVSRQLEAARSFEVTFWRSAFTVLALAIYLVWCHGRGSLAVLRAGGWPLFVSGLMWCAMFTCFMLALTLTTVANVLITMSLSPLFTALLARFVLGQPVAPRTWVAIVLAGAGIAWMFGHNLSAGPGALVGALVALGVPVAAAINWTVLQRSGKSVDLVPALLVGALLSCALTIAPAWPFQASTHDIAWLAGLGILQLAVPCVIAVRLARSLPAPEISLLALLEIVFGIAWAWLGANEHPAPQVLAGGSLVLLTLAVNEFLALRQRSFAA
jgi:drug/metabolite transporter (DMT)-like permease